MSMLSNILVIVEHTALSPKVKGQLKQKRLIMSGNVLKVMTSNDIERNHFDKVCNGSLVKLFVNVVLILIKLFLKQTTQVLMMI